MAASIIDSLVVTLGLDAASFKTGTDDASKAINGVNSTVRDASGDIGKSLSSIGSGVAGLALKFTGLFFAVQGIADLVRGFVNLNSALFHLGIDSKNIGVASNELRRWEEVAELAGGTASDAIASAQGLNQAIFGLQFQGQMSTQLMMLQRLGVAYETATGKARDTFAVAKDLSKALSQQGFDQETRYNYALASGFSGGLATAIAQGPAALAKFQDQAKKSGAITQKQVDDATKTAQSAIQLQYSFQTLGADLLDKMQPAIQGVIAEFNKLIPVIQHLIDTISSFFGNSPATQLIAQANNPAASATSRALAREQIADIAHKYGVPVGALANLPAGTDVEAAAQRLASIYQQQNPGAALDFPNAVQRLLGSDLPYQYGAAPATLPPAWAQALGQYQGIPANPGALKAAGAPPVTPTAPRPPAAPALPGAPTAMTGTTTIQIDEINVNAPNATDANGVAAGIAPALRRKLLVTQADQGMV